MNTLVFITSSFPFEPGESFIETEFPFIYSNFTRVIIITKNVTSRIIRTIPTDVKIYRYNPTASFIEYLFIPIILFRNFIRIPNIYKDEIIFSNEISRPIKFRQKIFLLKKILKGLQQKTFIEKIIRKERIEGEITFYSY